jgi:hypothetical protein
MTENMQARRAQSRRRSLCGVAFAFSAKNLLKPLKKCKKCVIILMYEKMPWKESDFE